MSSSSEKSESGRSSEFQDNVSILRQIPFFSGLPLEVVKVFAYLCSREVFKADQHLFRQDEDDGRGYYIISGRAELLRTENDHERVLKTYADGSFIGSLALLSPMPRLYSLKVATPSLVCLTIHRAKFLKAVGMFPDIMPKMIRAVVDRIAMWEKQLLVEPGQNDEPCRQHAGISLI
jgi:CRP/FNR family transcriptional regulator, cyclic AMP receptor protein